MQSQYRNIQASLLRIASDFAEQHEELSTLYLDNFTDESQWPETDFVGVGEVNVDILDTYRVQCMFAVSTRNDTNLYRMSSLIGKLSGLFIPNKQHSVFDASTGRPIGAFYVLNGTRVGSPLPTKTQPIQPIGVSFESSLKSR